MEKLVGVVAFTCPNPPILAIGELISISRLIVEVLNIQNFFTKWNLANRFSSYALFCSGDNFSERDESARSCGKINHLNLISPGLFSRLSGLGMAQRFGCQKSRLPSPKKLCMSQHKRESMADAKFESGKVCLISCDPSAAPPPPSVIMSLASFIRIWMECFVKQSFA